MAVVPDAPRLRILIGFALLTFGILLLSDRVEDTAELIDAIGRWWPGALALVAVGCLATFSLRPFAPHPAWGSPALGAAGLLVISAVLLLSTTGALDIMLNKFLLPSTLIAFGILIPLLGGRRASDAQPFVTMSSILCRRSLRCRAELLHHLNARAVLGDVVLDLSSVDLRSARAALDATVWLGRIYVKCPPSWIVDTMHVVGEVDIDIRPNPQDGPSAQKLIINAMGRGRITVISG